MLSIFKPAPHKARLPAAEIDPTYRRLRWQIFLGIFFGYAAYYLVRKNFALAMPYLVEQGFSRGDLGFALSGISIAYGFSKFIMGSVSDRSNPRVFLPAGLILAAAVMLFMGFVPWATSSIAVMFVLLFLCGWFQGMGWPPCGRTMVHWWSQKERGGIVSVWNCAHNVGGGIPPAGKISGANPQSGLGAGESVLLRHVIVVGQIRRISVVSGTTTNSHLDFNIAFCPATTGQNFPRLNKG